MKEQRKKFHIVITAAFFGALLPFTAFAQFKTVTTVTSPTETIKLNTATGVVAPVTSPTQTITTDAAKTLAPATGVIAPTSPTLVAPTKIVTDQKTVVAPIKTVTDQKTVTAVPPLPTPKTTTSAPVTAERYAAAQVIYQSRNLRALQSGADASADGVAEGLPLQLVQLPGAPTVSVVARRAEGIGFSVSGGGAYDVRGMVLDTGGAALESFNESPFTVLLDAYANPAAVAVLVTYIPEKTLTFAEGTGGIVLPPPAGITPPPGPIVPAVPSKPVAIQPVTPEAPEMPGEVFELTLSLEALPPLPGEGGIVREIPPGEEAEEIISEEGEVFEPIAEEGVPEETSELPEEASVPEGEEVIEEPGFFEDIADAISGGVEAVGDFFSNLFGPAEAPEEVSEEAPEEASFEGDVAFEGDEAGDSVEEGEEFFEGEPDGLFETVGDFFADLFGGKEAEPAEEALSSEEAAVEEQIAELTGEEAEAIEEEAEQFTPDATSIAALDYLRGDDGVYASLSLEGLFEFDETPLIASLIFASIANPARQLEFSEPIPDDLAVEFRVPLNVLGILGAEQRVLLKLTSQINGLSVVSTDVLGVAHGL